jgi:hypothetical protein
VSAARDIDSPVAPGVLTNGSGLRGVALITPEHLAGVGLVHLPINFQATSSINRAYAIVEAGGLLSIKAHAIPDAMGYIALDGLDHRYCDRLRHLFGSLHEQYGDLLWWTSMDEVANRFKGAHETPG